MKLNEVLEKKPADRPFKRRSSQEWLKVYEDGTIRKAGTGKGTRGPRKVQVLTVVDLAADDWHYQHVPVSVSREDLLDAAKFVAKDNVSSLRTLGPVEFAKLLADQLNMD